MSLPNKDAIYTRGLTDNLSIHPLTKAMKWNIQQQNNARQKAFC